MMPLFPAGNNFRRFQNTGFLQLVFITEFISKGSPGVRAKPGPGVVAVMNGSKRIHAVSE